MKIPRRFAAISCLIGICITVMGYESEKAAYDLACRVAPRLADNIIFEEVAGVDDFYSVSSRNEKILIQGSSAIAMSVGLNNYLRQTLGTSVSWFASQPVELPEAIILPEAPITGKAVVDERFFLNYCTFGYTMPYWSWTDWERFIDWMALNGINMPLAMTGQEKIWYETWLSFGLSSDAILQSFTGPSHLPWHWMANIDHYAGPLSLNWLKINEDLQKQILLRERQLGMKPVLPAFSGHVPSALKELYPDAKITRHKQWCGFRGDDNTWFLDPSDPLYAEIQHKFVTLQDSIYGSDHIYGVDPFNELDSPDWSEDFLRNVSANIYSTLTAADPEARWLQMTWTFYNDSEHWTKPRIKAFLEGVPDKGLILLDYYCEAQPVWELTDAYFGKPYILCYLGNFGGNTMLIGDLGVVDKRINDFLEQGGDNKCGMGGTLEGLDVNPIMHEFMLAKVWNPELTPDAWVDLWADTRGAKHDAAVNKAWHILNDKVYVAKSLNGQGGLTNVRPSLTARTSGCANANYSYDNSDLVAALKTLLEAAPNIDSKAYRFDVMNLTRQALSNEFMAMRDSLTAAYNNNNTDKVKALGAQMESLLTDLDRIMATNADYSLKKWIDSARSKGLDDSEKDVYEKDARSLLTTWGYPGTVLNDYANRHWSGLISGYYKVRWSKFIGELIECMERGEVFDEADFRARIIKWEEEWVNSHSDATDLSDEDPVELARTFLKKYF